MVQSPQTTCQQENHQGYSELFAANASEEDEVDEEA